MRSKPYLTKRISEAAAGRLPATVYPRERKEPGYDGSITILKRWLAEQTRKEPALEIIRVETPPGRPAQVDWTVNRRGKNKLSAFVGTLGYGRLSFVWFTNDETFETLIDGHEGFFDAIDGVPRTILFDNMKTVPIDRNADGPGEHRFHAGFREVAKHHRFSPRMGAPYRAQTKGKVARFIHARKRGFVWPLESRLKGQGIMLDADIATAHVGAWPRDVANSRIHAETKAQPIERFVPDAAHLLPRGPAWRELAPAIPADPRTITVPRHDLAIHDAVGGMA